MTRPPARARFTVSPLSSAAARWSAPALTLGLLYLASPVFVPLAFAIFILALVAPLRHAAASDGRAVLAATLTLVLTLAAPCRFVAGGVGFTWVIIPTRRWASTAVQQKLGRPTALQSW